MLTCSKKMKNVEKICDDIADRVNCLLIITCVDATWNCYSCPIRFKSTGRYQTYVGYWTREVLN